jgi:threonine dehydrogenase-like Zn-dependent dehydrogenase
MVSHHFSLEEVQKAFAIVANYNDRAIKVMIDFF